MMSSRCGWICVKHKTRPNQTTYWQLSKAEIHLHSLLGVIAYEVDQYHVATELEFYSAWSWTPSNQISAHLLLGFLPCQTCWCARKSNITLLVILPTRLFREHTYAWLPGDKKFFFTQAQKLNILMHITCAYMFLFLFVIAHCWETTHWSAFFRLECKLGLKIECLLWTNKLWTHSCWCFPYELLLQMLRVLMSPIMQLYLDMIL